MPISFFEGVRPDEDDRASDLSVERRFDALAAAVRDHQSKVRDSGLRAAREDEDLYRRLRQLSGGHGIAPRSRAEHGVA